MARDLEVAAVIPGELADIVPDAESAELPPSRAIPVTPDLRIERLLWRHGVQWIAGVDEAGRGALAGPVVAAAVVLPLAGGLVPRRAYDAGDTRPRYKLEKRLQGVRDSKQLSPVQRSAAARVIRRVAKAYGIGFVPATVVDEFGLTLAGQLAFARAVHALTLRPEYLLVDGFPLWSPSYPQTAVLHGDAMCLSIAAASILAKVARDELMARLDEETPGYGFAHNCGYGTPEHLRALEQLGPSVHHRRSYEPVAAVAKNGTERATEAVGAELNGLVNPLVEGETNFQALV